ncbi:MAG: recombination regulator RecX [Proteobacteria bacterium]|nr:recombination regulator RecX [Pseudomonadota bacterium]
MAERKSTRARRNSENREVLIWNYACDLLSRRIYSERELQNKLQKRYPQDTEIVNTIIEKLKYYKYLNDSENAKILIEHLKNKGYGPRYITSYLLRKGFVDINWDVNYDYNMMKKWYEKKRGNEKIRDLKTFRKMYNYLLSKGFLSEEIIEFLKGWTDYERE